MKKNLNNKGITLAELIVSIALVAVAAVYFYQTLYTVNKLYKKSNDEVDEYVDENYYTRALESYYEYVTSSDNYFKINIVDDSKDGRNSDVLTTEAYLDINGAPSTRKIRIYFQGCFSNWNYNMDIGIPRFSVGNYRVFLNNINNLYINNSSSINKLIDFTCLNDDTSLCERLGLEYYNQFASENDGGRYKYSHSVGYYNVNSDLINTGKFAPFSYHNNCFNDSVADEIENGNNFWFAVEYNNTIEGYNEKFGFDERPKNYYNPKYKLFLSVGAKDGKTYKYYKYFDHEKHLIDYETIITLTNVNADRFKIWFNKDNTIVAR